MGVGGEIMLLLVNCMFGGGEWSVFSRPEFTADREGKGVLEEGVSGRGRGCGGGGAVEGKGVLQLGWRLKAYFSSSQQSFVHFIAPDSGDCCQS